MLSKNEISVLESDHNYGDIIFGQSEHSSGITILLFFCGCLREKNTHLERLDDTIDMGVFCGQNFEREYIDVLLNKLLLCVTIQIRK